MFYLQIQPIFFFYFVLKRHQNVGRPKNVKLKNKWVWPLNKGMGESGKSRVPSFL